MRKVTYHLAAERQVTTAPQLTDIDMDRPEYRITRADFSNDEDWARYLHEAGLPHEQDGRGRDRPHWAIGPYGQMRNAIHGWEKGEARPTRSGPSTTAGLTKYDAEKLYRALAFAAWQSSFLNVHLGVTWSTVGVVSDLAVCSLHQSLMDLMRRWLASRGVDARFVWVLERGSKRGLHSHIYLHMPQEQYASFRAWATRSVTRLSGQPCAQTAKSKTVWSRAEWRNPAEAQWRHWAGYILKGSDGTWSLKRVTPTDEGTITGKRAGVSRSLDENAQRTTKFPRQQANIKTIRGNPFDGRFDNGALMAKLDI